MTAVTEPFGAEGGTARREERLLRLLERASASSRFNLGERWLFVAGGALVVLGFVAVVIGWVGASHTVLVAGQIPYLLSGGLVGLGLVFVGAFLYFGHWLAVLVRESRERGVDDREDLATLREGIAELNRSLQVVAGALGATPATAGARHFADTGAHEAVSAVQPAPAADLVTSRIERAGGGTGPVLLATATGTMAHRPGCRALAGKPNLRPVQAADGLKPCGMCRPLDPALRP
jgi:hypothetical protein